MRQEVRYSDKEIVTAIRRRLSERVGKERFELWFGANVQFRYEGETLHVEAADTFTVERLRRQMRGVLTSVVEDELGDHVAIVFAATSSLIISDEPTETSATETSSSSPSSTI